MSSKGEVCVDGVLTARHLKERSTANVDLPVSKAEDRIEENIGDIFVDIVINK